MITLICQDCGKPFQAENRRFKRCQECSIEHKRKANRERMAKARLDNPEYREYQKEWYQSQGVEYHRNWRHANPEYRAKMVQLQREKERKDPTLKKRNDALHYQRHKQDRRAQIEQWQKDNPDKLRRSRQVRNVRRRALMAKAEGNWTYQQFQELCEQTGNLCWYCHKQSDKLTVDHIIPVSRGGTNDITNIAPACLSCNATKRNKTPLEFMRKT